MVTDFELRVLSELSYINELASEFTLGQFQKVSTLPNTSKKLIHKMPIKAQERTKNIIQNWIILETYRRANNTGINSQLDAYLFCRTDGYFVIVYRGTNPKSLKQLWYDMKENLYTFFPSQVTIRETQYWQSVAFTTGCIKTFNIPEDKLILTGHSKGGAIASKVAYFLALSMNKTIKTLTYAPARIELSFIHYLDQTKPNIDCQNFINEKDRVTGSLTRFRFVTFWMMFNWYKLSNKQINHLSKKGFFVLWQMWILHPYLGTYKVFKPKRRSLLHHSLSMFDDHFGTDGNLN